MRPICVPCQRFYRCIHTGFYFLEGMRKEDGAPPGKLFPQLWEPYGLWSGDKFRCEGCGSEIISGVGRSPIAEHFQKDFAAMLISFGATQFQVNDC